MPPLLFDTLGAFLLDVIDDPDSNFFPIIFLHLYH